MRCQALKCFEPSGIIICVEEREEMFPQMSVVFIVKLPVSGDLCFWPRVGKLADIPRVAGREQVVGDTAFMACPTEGMRHQICRSR